jgi:hypothetical protein
MGAVMNACVWLKANCSPKFEFDWLAGCGSYLCFRHGTPESAKTTLADSKE